MIDLDQARQAVAGGRDNEVVGVTRRWLKRAIYELELARNLPPVVQLDFNPSGATLREQGR